jgi:hypothetical protein
MAQTARDGVINSATKPIAKSSSPPPKSFGDQAAALVGLADTLSSLVPVRFPPSRRYVRL